jgi:polyphosphate kinase
MDTKEKTKDTQLSSKSINLHNPGFFINRELGLLEFHRRVLEEAEDTKNPLLERVKFLAIVGANLDEFYMVRVSGVKKQVESGVVRLSMDGYTPQEQLAAIRKLATQIMIRARHYLNTVVIAELANAGIYLLDYDKLDPKQKSFVDDYFDEVIFPIITPLAFDPGHPFPHISNLSLNLALTVRDQRGKEHFARIKVPVNLLPRFIPVKRSSGASRKDGTIPHNHYFVWIEQVIAAHAAKFFPGMEVIEVHPFRVIRDADMEIQELEAADLLETMEQSVRQRRFGSVVRLTVNSTMPAHILNLLIENLEIERNDVYILDGYLGLSDLMALYNIDRWDLKELPFKPAIPYVLRDLSQDGNIFATIQQGDILLHHPYDSFTPVIDFLKAAARDPDVMAIKQTLYRVGRKPPVVDALLEAQMNGKQVAVLVELKARFDEESNIGWAKMLEREGVHVIYGLLGLKTHSKIALVIRKEGEGIRRYVHLATGNYNAITAQLYEDIGMFTCDEAIGADATDLFNYLTGYSHQAEYRKLMVAPVNLRSRMEQLIEREIAHQQKNKNGHLIFKVNALLDEPMIVLLYKASQAGVKIDLLVRGNCSLKPGVENVSENIRVISIVGRFLEHSRIYYFFNNGKEEVILGSADLMPRNINRRVEVLFPVQAPKLIRKIKDEILDIYLQDNVKARIMLPDGQYERVTPDPDAQPMNSQAFFLEQRGRNELK